MAYQDHTDYQDAGHLDFSDHADGWESSFNDHSDVTHGDASHSDVAHVDGYAGGSPYSFQDYSGMGASRYWHNDAAAGECLPGIVGHIDSSGYMQLAVPSTWSGPCSSTRHSDAGNLPGKAKCNPMPAFYDYTDHGDYGDHSDVAHVDGIHTDSVHADFNDSTTGGHLDGTDHQDSGHEDASAHNDVTAPPAPTDLSAAAVM